MEKNFISFFSNSLEKLAVLLSENLFQGSPFQKKWVVVQDLAMKTHLMEKFAKGPHGIAAGVPILTLGQFLDVLLENDGGLSPRRIPSLLELSFTIESIIRKIFSAWRECSHKDLFYSLIEYFDLQEVHGKMECCGGSYEKRLPGFCDKLAHAFEEHGVWGGELKEHWQEFLYEKVFKETWISPMQLLSHVVSLDSFYLFHIGFLPPIYLEFFKKSDAVFYGLSPCQLYWGDICSDEERVFFLKKWESLGIKPIEQEEWNGYVAREHRLLSNLGKLGREAFRALQENCLSYDFYESFEEGPLGALPSLQRSILLLEDADNKQKIIDDGSLQLHVAPSVFRELEICKQVICGLLDQNCQKGEKIELEEVVVMSPNIDLYLPYLDMVFGKEEPILPFQYEGMTKANNSLHEGMRQLLCLAEKGFGKEDVSLLFNHPRFLEKFSLERKEACDLRLLLKEIHLPGNDWKYAIKQLLLGFMMAPSKEGALVGSVAPVEVNEDGLALLVKFIQILESMQTDLRDVSRGKTIKEWGQFFLQLLKSYFLLKEEDEHIIQKLHAFCYAMKDEEALITFSSAKRMLPSFLSKKNKIFSSKEKNSIRFCNFDFGKFPGAKMLYLLGMDEESFPRKEIKNAFVNEKKKTPSKADFDRYLFLEALISVQKHLVISYQRFSLQDHKEQKSSFVVQELFQYLNRAFYQENNPSFSENFTIVHPALAFDPVYFSGEKSFFSYSQKAYEKALSYLLQLGDQEPFLSRAAPPRALEDNLVIEIDIKQLKELARHPIQFYFHEKLGFKLKEIPKKEEFKLSVFDRSYLYKQMGKKPMEETLKYARAKGMIPDGFPGKLIERQMVKESDAFIKNLGPLQIPYNEILHVILQKGYKSPFLNEEGVLFLPPLEVFLEGNIRCVIVGELQGVTSKGLLVSKNASLKELAKIWPLYLIYSMHPAFHTNEKRILFSREDLQECRLKVSQDMLACYLRYFLVAKENISFCMPDWIDALAQKDEASLSKKILKAVDEEVWQDSYLCFLKKRKSLFSAEELCREWSDYASLVFSPLLEARYETL